MLYLSQIIMLYTLNLDSAVCQSYLKKKLEEKMFSNKGGAENSIGGKKHYY